MPSRPTIPDSGQPIARPGQPGSLRETLAEIAVGAGRQDWPSRGIVAADGTGTAPPPQVSIGLFELTGNFQSGTPSPAWTNAPGSAWYWAPATRLEYYPATASPANTWNTPAAEGDSATAAETATLWVPAAILQSARPAAGYPLNPSLPAASGDRVWAVYDEGPGCWVVLARDVPRIYAGMYNGGATGSGQQILAFPYNAVPSDTTSNGILLASSSPAATIQFAGIYLLTGSVQGSQAFTMNILKNGTALSPATINGVAGGRSTLSLIVACAAGDTLDLAATANSGSASFEGDLAISLLP